MRKIKVTEIRRVKTPRVKINKRGVSDRENARLVKIYGSGVYFPAENEQVLVIFLGNKPPGK